MMPEEVVETVTGETEPASAPIAKVPSDDEWYTLKDIAPMLSVSYDRLRGFSEAPGVRELLETKKSPTGKGIVYGAGSVDMFRAMIRGQEEGRLTPKTAAAFLRMLGNSEPGEPASDGGHTANGQLARLPISDATLPDAPAGSLVVQVQLAPTDVLSAIRDGQEAGAERAIREQDERWYSLKEAHEAFGISLGALHKISFVEGGRRKVLKSDVLAYMKQYLEQVKADRSKKEKRAIGPKAH